MLQQNCFIRVSMYFVLCRSLPWGENPRGFLFVLLAHAGVSQYRLMVSWRCCFFFSVTSPVSLTDFYTKDEPFLEP